MLFITVRAYRDLPASVPYHFDGYGNPDTYGPRPMIFIVPVGFVIAPAIWAGVMVRSGFDPVSAVCITGTVIDFVLFVGFFLQRGILNVAAGKSEKIHPYAFWRN